MDEQIRREEEWIENEVERKMKGDGSAIQAQSGRDTGNWKSCAKRMGFPQSGSGEADKQGSHQHVAGAKKVSAPDR